MKVLGARHVRTLRIPALLIAALIGAGATAAAAQPAAAPPPSVTVAPVVRAVINPVYTFVGQTLAVAQVDLQARVKGSLERRNFVEGGDVTEGTLLFVIERSAYQAEVDQKTAALAEAKASLALSEVTLARRQQAAKSGAVSKLEVDIAAAEAQVAASRVQAAAADLEQAELDLSYTHVRAPIAGRIGRERYSVGNLVGPESGSLATIVQLDPIYVTFGLAEASYLDFQQAEVAERQSKEPEQKARFTLRLPNRTEFDHEGTLNFVDNEVNPTTGTVSVRVAFPNPDKLLLPGQFVTVQIQAKQVEDEGLVIPQSAVQNDQAGNFVLVVDADDTVEVQRVVMGERVGINWQVLEGLAEGERVIYQGIQKARPGGKVAAIEQLPADPTGGGAGQ